MSTNAIDRLEEKVEKAQLSARRARREVDELAQEIICDGLTFGGSGAAGFLDGAEISGDVFGIESNTIAAVLLYGGGKAVGGDAGEYIASIGKGFAGAQFYKMGHDLGTNRGTGT